MKSNIPEKILILQISFFLIFISLGNISAQTLEENSPGEKLKIGLALSGGGALGIAHIGVIQAFEEEGIPIDIIAGTSMGSIVGGLYASGYSSSEQCRIVEEIDWINIFNSKPRNDAKLIGSRYGILEPLLRLRFKLWEIYIPPGFNNGQSISNELFYYTSAANFAGGSNFDNLSIPYRAVAVDTSTGEAVSLGQGDLAQALRASMAIPMIFYPTRFENRLLIDGGVLNNLPTDVVSAMGADIIIACDVLGVPSYEKEPRTIAEVAQHTMDIAFYELVRENIKLADILIEPDLKGHEAYDFTNLDNLIEYGYKAARARKMISTAQNLHLRV
jgi:NTE family protein